MITIYKDKVIHRTEVVRGQVRGKGGIAPRVQIISAEAMKSGVVVTPPAKGMITRWIRKAEEVGTIDPEHRVVVTKALVAGAHQVAQESQRSVIVTRDIKKGWEAIKARETKY